MGNGVDFPLSSLRKDGERSSVLQRRCQQGKGQGDAAEQPSLQLPAGCGLRCAVGWGGVGQHVLAPDQVFPVMAPAGETGGARAALHSHGSGAGAEGWWKWWRWSLLAGQWGQSRWGEQGAGGSNAGGTSGPPYALPTPSGAGEGPNLPLLLSNC